MNHTRMQTPPKRPSTFFDLGRRLLGTVVAIVSTLAGLNVSGRAAQVSFEASAETTRRERSSCFLLSEIGVGQMRREPSSGCATRMTPASTFKIPHALAALDAGVLSGPDAAMSYDGSSVAWPSWQRDHTLASAMHSSVLWYFQRLAQRLGPDRERDYLRRFDYGNQDASSG
jgi:beta-lactamase class D